MVAQILYGKVAGVKVYPRQNQIIRPHAVTTCISNVTSQADFSWKLFFSPWCHMDDACTYCMGSDVSISSQIYLYSSYFDSMVGPQHSKVNVVNWLHWHYTMWFLYSVDLYNRSQCKKHVVQLREFWKFLKCKSYILYHEPKGKSFQLISYLSSSTNTSFYCDSR